MFKMRLKKLHIIGLASAAVILLINFIFFFNKEDMNLFFFISGIGLSTSSQQNKLSNSVENKKINWKQDKCPWSSDDKQEHKCAEKNICVCDFFQGIEEPDVVLCSYGEKI